MNAITLSTAAGSPDAGTQSHTRRPRSVHAPEFAPDDPDVFLRPLLDCLPTVRRAMAVMLGAVLAFDVCAIMMERLEPDAAPGQADLRLWLAPWAGGIGAALATVSAAMVAVIQVRYTFEHAALHRARFYELKLARFREACAQLKSLAVDEAVAAVKAVQSLRKDIGGLDRRLAIETLMLRRRLRDLVWLSRLAVCVLALVVGLILTQTGHAGLGTLATVLIALGAVAVYAPFEIWVRGRMSKVLELLSGTPGELAQAFDPSPPLEAAVERLLTRVNRHFDRLKGPSHPEDGENEPIP